MSDNTVGWTRTTVNSLVAAALAWAIGNISWFDFLGDIDLNDGKFIVASAAITGVVWRLSMWATERFPDVGWVLFGIKKPPSYGDGDG